MDIPPAILMLRPRIEQIHKAREEFNLTYDIANMFLHGLMENFYKTCKVNTLGAERAIYNNLSEDELDAVHKCMVDTVRSLIGRGAQLPIELIIGKRPTINSSEIQLITTIFGENEYENRLAYFRSIGEPFRGWFEYILPIPAELPLAIDFINFGTMPAISIINQSKPHDLIQYHISITPERLGVNTSNGKPMLKGYHFTNWFYPGEKFAKRNYYTNEGKRIVSKQHAKKLGRQHAFLANGQKIFLVDDISNNNTEVVETVAAAPSAAKEAGPYVPTIMANDIKQIPKSYSISDVVHIDEANTYGVIFYDQMKNEVGRFPISNITPIGPYEYEAVVVNKEGIPIKKHNGKPLVVIFLRDDERNISLPLYVEKSVPNAENSGTTLKEAIGQINNSAPILIQAFRDLIKALSMRDPIYSVLLFILAHEYYLDTVDRREKKLSAGSEIRDHIVRVLKDELNMLPNFMGDIKMIKSIYDNKALTDIQKRKEIDNIINQSLEVIKTSVPSTLNESILNAKIKIHPLMSAFNELIKCMYDADGKKELSTAQVQELLKECFRKFHPIYKEYMKKLETTNDKEEIIDIQTTIDFMNKRKFGNYTFMQYYDGYKGDFDKLNLMKARRNARTKKRGGVRRTRRRS